MTEPLAPPEGCTQALAAVLADPITPGVVTEAHLKACATCSEIRVAFLAQEEARPPLVPEGYFERLPSRVLGKLPVPPRYALTRPFYWGLAATLLLAVGATSFWVGRANRTPLVEASLSRTASELPEMLPDAPFVDHEDAVTQLTTLSPQEAEAVFRALDQRQQPSSLKK